MTLRKKIVFPLAVALGFAAQVLVTPNRLDSQTPSNLLVWKNSIELFHHTQLSAERAAIVVPAPLTMEALEPLVRRYLSGSKSTLSELFIGTDAKSLEPIIQGTIKPEHEPTFGDTLEALEFYRTEGLLDSRPIARVIRIKNAAVLSVREAGQALRSKEGIESRVILGNSDPTRFQVGKNSYQFLTFDIPTWPRGERLPIAAFFRSDAVTSCAECEALAKVFSDATGATDLQIQIRPDSWFSSEYFPVIFRFESDRSPSAYSDQLGRIVAPTLNQYYRRQHIFCRFSRLQSVKSSCDGYGRYDHVP